MASRVFLEDGEVGIVFPGEHHGFIKNLIVEFQKSTQALPGLAGAYVNYANYSKRYTFQAFNSKYVQYRSERKPF